VSLQGSTTLRMTLVDTTIGFGGVPQSVGGDSLFEVQLRYLDPATGEANTFDLGHRSVVALAGAPATLDMRALVGLKGQAQTWARVREFGLRVRSSDPLARLLVRPDIANAWTALMAVASELVLYPSVISPDGLYTSSGMVVWIAPSDTGYPVEPTNRNLVLDPGPATFDVDVWARGASI
jgi:hypothetical protein